MGCDLIRLKLVKIVADQFAEPLTCIINSAFTQSIFPNKAKEASDTPFDKGKTANKFLITSPYALKNSYQFSCGLIVSIMEHNMCLYIYLRNRELILIKMK